MSEQALKNSYFGGMIRSLVHVLIDPSTYLVLAFLFLWAFAWQKSSPGVRRLLWVGLILPAVLLGLPIVDYLIEKKERQFPVVELSTLDTGASYLIVVLGAGKTSDPDLLPTQQINSTTAVRLLEGYRLYRHLPRARLALSGANFGSGESQAEVTAQASLALGVDPADTLQLRGGVHTQSEINQVAQRRASGEKLIVVSSAVHLPRAHFWVASHALSARMAPAHFLVTTDPTKSGGKWQNSPAQRIVLWRTWWHETLGLMHARWLT